MPKPRHKPTAVSRRVARYLCLIGLQHEDIAKAIGIDDKTLRLRYPKELAESKQAKLAQMAQNVQRLALRSTDDAVRLRASTFWLSTQDPEHWAQKQKHEVSGPNGGPIEVSSPKNRLLERIRGMRREHGSEPGSGVGGSVGSGA